MDSICLRETGIDPGDESDILDHLATKVRLWGPAVAMVVFVAIQNMPCAANKCTLVEHEVVGACS